MCGGLYDCVRIAYRVQFKIRIDQFWGFWLFGLSFSRSTAVECVARLCGSLFTIYKLAFLNGLFIQLVRLVLQPLETFFLFLISKFANIEFHLTIFLKTESLFLEKVLLFYVKTFSIPLWPAKNSRISFKWTKFLKKTCPILNNTAKLQPKSKSFVPEIHRPSPQAISRSKESSKMPEQICDLK